MGNKKETKLNQDLAAAMPPGHFRIILKKKKFNLRLQASSGKQQAASIKQQALDKPGL